MKTHLISVLIFLTFPLLSTSQIITLQELMDVTFCEDISCYKNFIEPKGFCFDKEVSNDESLTYRFSSCEDTEGDLLEDKSTFSLLGHGAVIVVSYATSSPEYYNSILKEMEEFGFIKKRSWNLDVNATNTTYQSKKHPGFSMNIIETDKPYPFDRKQLRWSISVRRFVYK